MENPHVQLLPIADDFGLHPDINQGILDCLAEGLLAGTSVAVCGDAAEDEALAPLAARCRQQPELDCGIHLMLCEGRALTGVSSLTDATGRFPEAYPAVVRGLLAGRLRLADVEREWDAQIRRLQAAGISPRHLDGHQHVHLLPGLWPLAVRLARTHGIPRLRTSYQSLGGALRRGAPALIAFQQLALVRYLQTGRRARTLGVLCSTDLTAAGVLDALVGELRRGRPVELMSHPGRDSEALRQRFPTWGAHWGQEVQELRRLQALVTAAAADPARQAAVRQRYADQPWVVRSFVETRLRLCPIWVVEALLPAQGRIVDLGCGHGHFSLYLALAAAGREVLGADDDPRKIAVAQAVSAEAAVTFVPKRGDELLASSPGPFDAALLLDVLYQLPPAAQERLLGQVHEQLVDGGVLVLKETDRHLGPRYGVAYLEECLVVSLLRRRPAFRYHYRSAADWTALLTRLGFTVDCCLPTPAERLNNRSVILRAVRTPRQVPTSALDPGLRPPGIESAP
ncbi:MAG: ChbG/HpnK family deacetylase [Myxococcota bacterium]|nr:ChbG/HpnK family deacetylase [Myxococcota bacterium]